MSTTPPRPPQASRSSSRSSSHEQEAILDLYTHQAGRSGINLAAQQSAQSLREASRFAQLPRNRSATGPDLRRRDRSSPSLANKLAPPRAKRSHSHFAPAIPSPLNPASYGLDRSVEKQEACEEGTSRLSALGVSVPEIRLPDKADAGLEYHASRLYKPRSVRDLGSDYTRYFDPFQPLPKPVQEPAQPTSNTHLLVAAKDDLSEKAFPRRLSDPFKDSKQISNPFECSEDARVGAEQNDESNPSSEKRLNSTASSVSSRSDPMVFIDAADPEKTYFFQFLDDRLGAPDYSFPLITDQKEDDDEMHMPQWDDDVRLKPRFKDHFTPGSIFSTLGLFLMLCGLLFVFVILPIISYTGTSLLDLYETPLEEMPGLHPPAEPWSWVNDRDYPLLKNVRQGLIDPDTPKAAMTRKGVDGEVFVLVFSDEFNKKNRTFYPGDDAYWRGFDGWYAATNDLEWYDPDAINIDDGALLIQMDDFRNHNLDFRSGMLNSWNQVCFKGGIFEVSISLPGPAGAHGLWPGIWTMGNLGRPGYLATTDGLWPYTYNECDAGITANQSNTDGLSYLPGQRLPSCTCSGEDHPTPGTGRGAPEIDIAEISADWGDPSIGVATQSYQVAPFDIWYYPDYRFMQNPDYNLSFVNSWTGDPYQQAISTTTMLNNNWYDGRQYQKFAFEYSPGDNEHAYVAWMVGEEEMMRFDARAIGPNGNIGQRVISQEPMSIIMNLGISYNWVAIQWPELRFPTVLRIDYVRWYQRKSEQMVTCDPPGYETTEYIANHPAAYGNPNVTRWEDAGYSWPENSLVDGCWP